MHQRQTLALNLLDHHTQNLLLRLCVLWQEYQTSAVLTLFRYWDTLQQNKLMWNLYHNTGTITSLIASLSSTMFHVFQHLQCIVHQIVTLSAVDVHYHSNAASIMLIVALIESFLVCLSLLSFCHIILH